MKNSIVYYVVSPVHVRNVQLLAAELDEWDICLAYDAQSPWLDAQTMGALPFKAVEVASGAIPESVWGGNVRALVLSTAQVRPIPIVLLEAALARGIPTISLEESNQIALNRGTVNNYILPTDFVLVASEHERRGMVDAGFPVRRFEATGWPFYNGRIGAIAAGNRRARKEALGLNPDRPVAALTLTGLLDAGESPAVRRRQLSLAAQGLPPEYQLVIKPHPIEKREVLQPFVDECAPNATVIEGMVKVEELLEATDVLLNRGVSQVCIEALLQDIPIIVLETGITTPFHGLTQDIIVERAEDLSSALKLLGEGKPMAAYGAFQERHMPFVPSEARRRTCQRIVDIALGGERDPAPEQQILDLVIYGAWKFNRRWALQRLDRYAGDWRSAPVEELRALIAGEADREALQKLRSYYGSGFQAHVLRCLWIDQVEKSGFEPEQADWQWMESFPPEVNGVWFVPDMRQWV